MKRFARRSGYPWKAVFLGAIASVSLLAACGSSSKTAASNSSGGGTGTKLNFTLAATYTPQYAPWYYGVKEGYFSKKGVDLKVLPATGSSQSLQAMGQGRYDCGVVDTGTASQFIDKGLKATIVSLIQPVDNYGIISLRSSGITQPSQLIGKTVAMSPTSAAAVLFPAFLKAQHLSTSQIKVQSVALSAVVALAAEGKVDAIAGNGYSQGELLAQQASEPYSVLTYANYGVKLTGNGIICTNSFLAAHPDTVRAFLAAANQTFAAAQQNPSAAAAAGAAANEAVSTSATKETAELQAALATIKPAVAGRPLGYSTPAMWAQSLQILHEYLGVKNTDPSHYYTNQYLSAS